MRKTISFLLNGVKREVGGEYLFQSLSSYLRYEKQLTGTKVVCAEGDCGACTVMVAKKHPFDKARYMPINSCIALVFSLDGASVVTVEGLSNGEELCEVQNSMVRNFGGQCGFCTPGFVMAIAGLYEQHEKPNVQKVKNHLTGNLCRCTGYKPIIDAALDVDFKKHQRVENKYPVSDFSAQLSEPIFCQTAGAEFFAPVDIKSACEYKANNPDVYIFSGATDLGVQINKGHVAPKKFMSLHLVTELYRKSIVDGGVEIGARVTLTDLQKLIEKEIPKLDQYLHIFASPQIKNSATLVGNLANASPIGDTAPALLALEAVLEIAGPQGVRLLPLHQFYQGYKKTDLKLGEIITAVRFRIPTSTEKSAFYKVSQRRDLDISTVNAGFNFEIEDSKVKTARIALGGVAATPLFLGPLSDSLSGRIVDRNFVVETKAALSAAIQPLSDHRGSADYRKILVENLFEKFAQEHLGL